MFYYPTLTAGLALLLLGLILLRLSRTFVYIPNDAVGIVEKLWSRRGSVIDGFISLDGRAGFEPRLLRGGLHVMPPFQYRVHVQPLVTIPQSTIGYVFARGGVPLPAGQTLASCSENISFEDVRAFLDAGGQRGPQRRILREGIHAINTAQFVVFTINGTHAVALDKSTDALAEMHELISNRDGFRPIVVRDNEDALGVVTVHDGPALDLDQIIAPVVGVEPLNLESYHNSFQDPERFLAAGGRRGRQEQVLLEGTFFINRLFATVEIKPKQTIEIGKVGVVVSYTGPQGVDITGHEYKHGELVQKGEKGVWRTPLQPGKYALNPYAQRVVEVPTTNFVLRWIKDRQEEHGFDGNISEIRLITKDAFEPIMPLSIVLHIAYEDAPTIVQQFADIKLLVEQTLDPMVSAYFKDTAQQFTLIELINKRAEIQQQATKDMAERFRLYRLNLKECMIGTPRPADGDLHIVTLLEQLRARQVAEEQVKTYENQQRAAEKQRALNEAEATARAQADLTRSKIDIAIRDNQGAAELAQRKQEAEGIKISALAQAARIRAEAEAEAYSTEQKGSAEAKAIEAKGLAEAASTAAQVEAFGGPQFQLSKDVAGILQSTVRDAKVALVPNFVVGAGGDGGSAPGVVDALLALVARSMAPEENNKSRPAA